MKTRPAKKTTPEPDLLACQLKVIRLARAATGRDGRPILTGAEIAAALGISVPTYTRRLRKLRDGANRLGLRVRDSA